VFVDDCIVSLSLGAQTRTVAWAPRLREQQVLEGRRDADNASPVCGSVIG